MYNEDMKRKTDEKKSAKDKKKYQKPEITHTTKIETIAGRCAQTVGCVPSQQ